MAKPVILTHKEYQHIKEDLVTIHGNKILISFVCRRELGFTFREHRRYDIDAVGSDWRDVHSAWYVDFYNDAAETMFRLKYL